MRDDVTRWIFLLTAYLLLRTICSEAVTLTQLLLLSAFPLLYLLGRWLTQQGKRILLWVIILSGVWQAAVAWLQLLGYLSSRHSQFACTGSFATPGPLGGWLTLCIAAIVALFAYGGVAIKRFRWPILFCLLIMLPIWVMADSRAAWLSLAVGLLLMWMEKHGLSRIKQGVVTMAFAALLLLPAYLYRPQSADSRLFIWKVCMEMVKDKPFLGEGPQGVQRNYMHYQADYLANKGNTEEQWAATTNMYAFNEPLRVTCEYGLVGLLLWLFVLGQVWRVAGRNNPFLLLLTVILLFSLFSYPFSLWPFQLLFALLLGAVTRNNIVMPAFRVKAFGVSLLLCIMLTIHHLFYSRVERAIDYCYWEEAEADFLRRYYPLFAYEKELSSRYARTLFVAGEYQKAIPALQQMIRVAPTSEIYCDLGTACMHVGDATLAEKYYLHAAALTPSLLSPHYHLFMLYHSMNQPEKAVAKGHEILQKRVKIENRQTKEMREEVRRILSGIQTLK